MSRAEREERDRLWRARRAVIVRYAKQRKDGLGVILCTPSRAELAGDAAYRERPGNTGKVAYPDRESAEACARELEALGVEPMRSFRCRRSDTGHHHLTRDWPRIKLMQREARQAARAVAGAS